MSEKSLSVGEVAEALGLHRKSAQRAMDEARERWGVGSKETASGWRSVRPEDLDKVREAAEKRAARNPVSQNLSEKAENE